MLDPEGVRAGRISKPYGLRGDVHIILESGAGDSMELDNPLFIDLDGQRVPFFIEELELLSLEQAIIKFEFVDNLEDARKLTGSSVYFDPRRKPDYFDEEKDLAKLVGFSASDRILGPLGTIADYLPHPMNPIFIIRADNKELMVPAVMDLIAHINHREQTVHFILPEGFASL